MSKRPYHIFIGAITYSVAHYTLIGTDIAARLGMSPSGVLATKASGPLIFASFMIVSLGLLPKALKLNVAISLGVLSFLQKCGGITDTAVDLVRLVAVETAEHVVRKLKTPE